MLGSYEVIATEAGNSLLVVGEHVELGAGPSPAGVIR